MKLADLNWLLVTLGVDTSDIPADAEVSIQWTNLPTSWWWFVLIGAVAVGMYFVFWMYRREINTAPTAIKILLGCLRVAVLLVLVVIALGPSLVHKKKSKSKPYIIVLRDASQSMMHRDAYLDDGQAARVAKVLGTDIAGVREDKPSRADLLSTALNANENSLLKELEYAGKVKILDFGRGIQERGERMPRPRPEELAANDETEEQPVSPMPEYDPKEQGSDIYKALEKALATRQVAGIVLLTDGQHTAKEHQRDEIIALAQQEGVPDKDRVPLLIVGVGDEKKPRDLAVSDLYADPQVFPEEPFSVEAVIRGQDVGGQRVRVDLVEQKLDKDGSALGAPKIVDSLTNQQVPESGKLDVRFKVEAGQPGKYSYLVRVEKIDNEVNTDNNEPDAPIIVKVLDDKAKLLLVAGAPTWEYRMVQRLLTREKTVDLSCWLQTLDENRAQEGNTVITHLPVTKKELYEYDVVMLFDPDPIEFDDKWIALLKEFVSDHAGGLLYMAGPKFTGQYLGGLRTRDVQNILPVRLGDVQRIEVDKIGASNTRSWPLYVVSANIDRPMMRFESDPGDSLARWRTLPGFYWSFAPEDKKPGARTLIEHNHPIYGMRPILVTGQYGTGRTVYMGFNGTWRWRKVGRNAEFFKRFWIQTTRYLIEGRSLEGRRRGYVEVDLARYQLGAQVTISVHELQDENFNLIEEPTIQASVGRADSPARTVTLKPIPNQPGTYRGSYTPRSTGQFNVRVEMPSSAGTNPPKIETNFAVTLPAVETNEITLNKPLLVDLASASGGDYFNIDELGKLPAKVPTDRVREFETPSEPMPLWDTSRLLILLVVLLSCEWALRKAYKLL